MRSPHSRIYLVTIRMLQKNDFVLFGGSTLAHSYSSKADYD